MNEKDLDLFLHTEDGYLRLTKMNTFIGSMTIDVPSKIRSYVCSVTSDSQEVVRIKSFDGELTHKQEEVGFKYDEIKNLTLDVGMQYESTYLIKNEGELDRNYDITTLVSLYNPDIYGHEPIGELPNGDYIIQVDELYSLGGINQFRITDIIYISRLQ